MPFAQHSIHVLQDQIHSLLQQIVVQVQAQQLGSIHFLPERGKLSQPGNVTRTGTTLRGTCSEP